MGQTTVAHLFVHGSTVWQTVSISTKRTVSVAHSICTDEGLAATHLRLMVLRCGDQAGLHHEIIGEISIHCDSFAAVRPAVPASSTPSRLVTTIAMDLGGYFGCIQCQRWLSAQFPQSGFHQAGRRPLTTKRFHIPLLWGEGMFRSLCAWMLFTAGSLTSNCNWRIRHFPDHRRTRCELISVRTDLATTDASSHLVY